MARLKRLLRSRNGIFLLGMIVALSLPGGAAVAEHLLLPALVVAITFSAAEAGVDASRRPRTLLFPALLGFVMNYVILGNFIIGLSAWIIGDEAMWIGCVLLAAVPPAVAVIPFSVCLKGSKPLSVVGTMGAYLGALAIMPLIALGLLSSTSFDPVELLALGLTLIALPLALSCLICRSGLKTRLEPYRGTVTNWSFFITLYAMIGLNRDVILGRATVLLPVAAVCLLSTFALGFLIEWVAGLLHVPRETRTSLVLLGTLKNSGVAGGIALTLFSREAALPAAMATVVMIGYALWLDLRHRWFE